MLLFFLLLPLGISCLNVTESPMKCFSNNTACDFQGDGLIDSYPPLCSRKIIGAINDNLLDFIPNIESEGDCRDLCSEKFGCQYYTYYYLKSCFLLSSLKPPIQDCPSCVTGPLHCDQPADCSFLYDGHNHTHLIFTEPGVNITFSTSGGSYFSECQLRVLAVGGGGDGYYACGGGSGGGGSGYIRYNTQTISGSQISVMVGDHDQASTAINMDTGDTVLARPGGLPGGNHYVGFHGGDGYSGGGGRCYCNGGSVGGDGYSGGGGRCYCNGGSV